MEMSEMNDRNLIDSPRPPWILVAPLGRSSDSVTAAAERLGGLVVRLDGRRLGAQADVFSEFATALSFPSYFGRNWDALEECLGDIYNWLRRDVVVVVLSHPSFILSGDAGEFQTFLGVLWRAAEWISEAITDEGVLNRPGVSMHFLLSPAAADYDLIVDRVRGAGLPQGVYAMID